MSKTEAPNREQSELWNQVNGPVWVAQQALLDRMLAPLADHLIAKGFPGEGRRVLDIGCGAGTTTLAMAARLGPAGRCLGVDISAPLIAAAKGRASSAEFTLADAQTYAFERGAFDAAISRFGVMFFEDPEAAFANIRTAMAPGGRLLFAAWRGPAENLFMTTAKRAVAPLLPPQPAADPDAPGQFAFADAVRVRRILVASGWRDIEIAPLDAVCEIGGDKLMQYLTVVGPVAAALRELEAAIQRDAYERLSAAFAPFVEGGVARFTAACWSVSARA